MTDRVEVKKTYKTYIGGKFPRTKSGRYYKVLNTEGNILANACRCSRKDIRDAVVAARSGFNEWAVRSAYNRGQILYRIGEMLESRKAQFIDDLVTIGRSEKKARIEVNTAIDRLIYYAGWTDKYQQVFGSINPVASSHFNFSKPEPMGIVAVLAPNENPLLGLISVIAPVVAGGNSCVVLASEKYPLSAISFAEVLHSSDVPEGVINILTGYRKELVPHMSSHKDINAFFYTDVSISQDQRKQIDENGTLNLKRIIRKPVENWNKDEGQTPYLITEFQEIKTTWHPIGM